MPFICGSFRSQEEDHYDVLWPYSSPSSRKSTRRRHSRRNKTATNRYADRGLDKFEALLAELDQKRRNILAQKGSEDISMVKFIYNNANEIEPVVIKLKDDQRKHHDTLSPSSTQEVDHKLRDVSFIKAEEYNTKPTQNIVEWWKPCHYLPLFMMLILVLLIFSGRSFAILCTSIGWYMVPVVNENLHNPKQPNNVKGYSCTLLKSRKTDKQ